MRARGMKVSEQMTDRSRRAALADRVPVVLLVTRGLQERPAVAQFPGPPCTERSRLLGLDGPRVDGPERTNDDREDDRCQ